VKKNQNKPEIALIDPRATETAKRTTHHYRIRPDSLLTFLYGIAHVLIKNGWIDLEYVKKHTTGFEEFRKHLLSFPPGHVRAKSGIDEQGIQQLAHLIHSGKKVSFWWTMGVNQNYQGVACAQAIINLALMTGNIGRPGTGANSITGQANAMGSRIFSNTTTLFGGHDFLNPAHRKKIADILGLEIDRIPSKNSWTYDQILKGIEDGTIKGLWIICTNPVHSWINKHWLLRILDNLEYLVVQDMYDTTETAQRADLFLPAAGCGEKEGTFINSERRIGVIKKIMDPPDSALPDFQIFRKIADYWGCGDLFSAWTSPRVVFDILKRISKGQPCDISGIKDYEMIDRQGGIQWPFPEDGISRGQERRLFEDGRYFHPDGKAKFFFSDIMPVPEEPGKDYPFVLLTGRGTVAQWHTQTRTGKVEMLKKMYPEDAYVEINPEDAERLNIKQNGKVIVRSKRGKVEVKAMVGDSVKSGELFMPMHYFETNQLTFPAFDPDSKEPSYKYAAVNIEPKEP
jgi:assimilatory nitrate reductase catalytic subunit